MAKVIDFYVPERFRKPHKWASQPQLGKVIKFGSPTKQSAFLWLKLSVAYEEGISKAPHGVDLYHARH